MYCSKSHRFGLVFWLSRSGASLLSPMDIAMQSSPSSLDLLLMCVGLVHAGEEPRVSQMTISTIEVRLANSGLIRLAGLRILLT
jgi:hypothetical protein